MNPSILTVGYRREAKREHFTVAIYYPQRSLTQPNPTANIDILAAGLLVLDGLALSLDRLARSHSGPRRLAWPRTSPFHGGNTGSNPVGDAKSFQQFRDIDYFPAGTKRHNSLANFWPGSPNRECFCASGACSCRHKKAHAMRPAQPAATAGARNSE